jgi:hypothetical protein
VGQLTLAKLKSLLPRQLFVVALQVTKRGLFLVLVVLLCYGTHCVCGCHNFFNVVLGDGWHESCRTRNDQSAEKKRHCKVVQNLVILERNSDHVLFSLVTSLL